MRDEHFFIAELLEKYPDLNQEEREQFNRWLEQGNNKEFFNQIIDKEILEEELRHLDELKIESQQRGSWEKLLQFRVKQQKTKIFSLTNWKVYAAASVLFIIAFIGIKWFGKKENIVTKETPALVQSNDVAPGQYKARLTLADGSVVALDSFSSTKVVQQGGTNVFTKDGQLIYQNKGKEEEVLYNTLVTAKGETFGIVLSDGTKVWLNSQSTLRYPVAFTGDERKVTITGEAFFEVAKAFVLQGNKSVKQTFKVVVDNMEVEVLGTHFNVNAYTDEDVIKTTLLEGKVQIVSGSTSALLKPGQQAQLKKGTTLLQVRDNADVEQAVAWKNGFFQFSDDDLKTVMRQLSRWYDVEVIYQGGVGPDTYGGRINRNSKASEVLTLLERNRVHFKIEGKKIIVTR